MAKKSILVDLEYGEDMQKWGQNHIGGKFMESHADILFRHINELMCEHGSRGGFRITKVTKL